MEKKKPKARLKSSWLPDFSLSSCQLRAVWIFQTICSLLKKYCTGEFTGCMQWIFSLDEHLCRPVKKKENISSHFVDSCLVVCAPGKLSAISAMLWLLINTVFSPSFSCRFHPHVRRQFKREERDDREPRLSVWISKWSELYLGDCGRGREQDSYSLSVFCSGGGIWLFIFVWWTSAPCQLQDKVRRQPPKPCSMGSFKGRWEWGGLGWGGGGGRVIHADEMLISSLDLA